MIVCSMAYVDVIAYEPTFLDWKTSVAIQRMGKQSLTKMPPYCTHYKGNSLRNLLTFRSNCESFFVAHVNCFR